MSTRPETATGRSTLRTATARTVVGVLLAGTAVAVAGPAGAATPGGRPMSTTSIAVPAASAPLAAASADGIRSSRDAVRSTGALDVDPFSMVAVTWSAGTAADLAVEVRTRTDGTWSGWTELAVPLVDEAPDPGTAEARAQAQVVGTAPLWVGEGADGVDVRVAGASAASAQGLDVDLVDPGTEPTPAATPLAAAAAAGAPAVITRKAWGADESLRCSNPGDAGTLKAAVVHHTAGSNSYTRSQSAAVVRGIYAYHTQTLGWCDVGYNFLVDKYGQVFEGRAGGMERSVLGAHAGGFNRSTFGVSMMGNYDVVAPPDVAVDAMAAVIAWKFRLAGIDPRGRTTLTSAGGSSTKYKAGTPVTVDTVTSHGIVSGGWTACPGRYLAARLGTLRDLVAAKVAAGSGTSPAVRPSFREATWMLRDKGGAGTPSRRFGYGSTADVVLSCDWNGTGRDGIAVFDPRTATWYLRDSATSGTARSFQFGGPGWTPVCGDWDGDGDENIGVVDPKSSTWHLRRWNDAGAATSVFQFGFGGAGSVPVVGDWDGDRKAGIGVYERRTGTWYLRATASPGRAAAVTQYGWAGAVPVVGDWDGDGRDSLGVHADGRWLLRDATSPGRAFRDFWYGGQGLRPVVGAWGGARADGTGVVG